MPVALTRAYAHEGTWHGPGTVLVLHPETEWSLIRQGFAEQAPWPANASDKWASERAREDTYYRSSHGLERCT